MIHDAPGVPPAPKKNLGILTEAHTQYQQNQQKTRRKPLGRETIEVGLLQQRLHICLGSFRRFLLKWPARNWVSHLLIYAHLVYPCNIYIYKSFYHNLWICFSNWLVDLLFYVWRARNSFTRLWKANESWYSLPHQQKQRPNSCSFSGPLAKLVHLQIGWLHYWHVINLWQNVDKQNRSKTDYATPCQLECKVG